MAKALSILLSAFLASGAHAIVNIEEVRGQQQADGLMGNASLSISGDSGNTSKSNVSASSQLFWQHGNVTKLIAASYRYGENSRNRNTNKGFIHLRYIKQQTPARALEVFTQAARNEFSRLSLRTLIGAGTRLTLHKNSHNAVHLGAGAFYLKETLETRPSLLDGGTEKFWRGNFYLALYYQINQQAHIVSTTYYQPALNGVSDFRILEEGSLKIKLTETLNFTLTLALTHDNEPPQTVEKTDVNYKTGIEYRF
ncbi:MAG: DUF481 domain-containing protein [Gammaproteobacteria bacterium]|nr:DUF481 domain-containing protein [Gammaproteobacteria bacterium]